MIQKSSVFSCCDKNGILLVNVFHLYRGYKKKYAFFASFIKVSVRTVLPVFLNLKKLKFRAFYNLSIFKQKKKDGSFLKFKLNNCVILKRRMTPLGKEILGPCNFNIFRKRFCNSFSRLI
jgi:ribosomal protein L14